LGGECIRPKAATPCGKTLEGGAVTLGQTKIDFNRKGILVALGTVAIATMKDHIAVNGNYVFRLVVLVARFFLQWGHALASAVVSVRSTRCCSCS